VLAGMGTSDFTILPLMEVSVKSGEGQSDLPPIPWTPG
jgi:hypothetical protein